MSEVTDQWPELTQGEAVLDDLEELLWRQVHPHSFHEGIISSQAFEPGGRDAKMLSCSRSSVVSARQAFEHHTQVLGLSSCGGAGVTAGEVVRPNPPHERGPAVASLRTVDDAGAATDERPLPPGHAYIDFRPLGASRISKKAKQLAFFANRRGGLQTE